MGGEESSVASLELRIGGVEGDPFDSELKTRNSQLTSCRQVEAVYIGPLIGLAYPIVTVEARTVEHLLASAVGHQHVSYICIVATHAQKRIHYLNHFEFALGWIAHNYSSLGGRC